MKRLGRFLGGLITAVLMGFSLQGMAAETQQSGRDFNHMSTGFMLQGGHAIVACETCHIGGIFKGTPRACDGCHALGKRIVATPKSSSHIVTDAPCETCHFNTSTFYDARFNHANATRGSCQTCHNGRLSNSKPSTHSTGNKATHSCDDCHRSVTWLPATWNHEASAVGRCSTCHISDPEVSPPNRKPAGHSATIAKNTFECDSCHNFLGWYPNKYKHTRVDCLNCHDGVTAIGKTGSHTRIGMATYICSDCHTTAAWLPAKYNHSNPGDGTCKGCHDNVTAMGTASYAGHAAIGTADCRECHSTTTVNSPSWAGALGAKPSNHIPYNAGVTCSTCHPTPTTWVTGNALHSYVSGVCKDCHNSSPVYLGRMTRKTIGSHEGSKTTQDCISSGCHARQFTRWNNP